MTNAVTTPQSFEEKLKARIKDSIGDLISNEDLSKLVERSVEEIFFKRRPNPKRTMYSHQSVPETIPPLINELVEGALTPVIQTAVNNWMENHKDLVLATVQDVVNGGVGKAVLSAMNRQFMDPLLQFQSEVYNKLSEK